MSTPDSACECDHVHEKHEASGHCTVEDCDCREFELNFLDMLAETQASKRILFPQKDGRTVEIAPRMFGKFQLCIGPSDLPVYDDQW